MLEKHNKQQGWGSEDHWLRWHKLVVCLWTYNNKLKSDNTTVAPISESPLSRSGDLCLSLRLRTNWPWADPASGQVRMPNQDSQATHPIQLDWTYISSSQLCRSNVFSEGVRYFLSSLSPSVHVTEVWREPSLESGPEPCVTQPPSASRPRALRLAQTCYFLSGPGPGVTHRPSDIPSTPGSPLPWSPNANGCANPGLIK